MTAGLDHWTFDAGVHGDVLHLIDHVARAVDGEVGQIELVSAQPNRGYLLVEDRVDAREVIVPAGSIAGQESDGAVKLRLTRQQIAAAPVFESARRNEREYFEMLAAYFSPLLDPHSGVRRPSSPRAA
jgi:hypothetical protein